MKNTVKRLIQYFTEGVGTYKTGTMVGIEVETQFTDKNGVPISLDVAKNIFSRLRDDRRLGVWAPTVMRNKMITELTMVYGNDRILYELGRHNIEISLSPRHKNAVVSDGQRLLWLLEQDAREYGAYPFLGPIIDSTENLLVIPDERDATWLALDGRGPLNLLARTSSVQFTFDVRPEDAIDVLNAFGKEIGVFLSDYPQDILWKEYISSSPAGYKHDRYGGPLLFRDIEDYCEHLIEHDVVTNGKLVPHEDVPLLNIPLFIRSVWWHFRLRRYGEKLCIEVRPLARRKDEFIQEQFLFVQSIITPFL